MGLKKYEIITVGSDKRVRALRSWQVGDRYVNIGDVGGIVYDEKTLSQDGLCWLFRGNFGFPGARIGGDSIVDVLEDNINATGAANTDILGSSVVVGAKLKIGAHQGSANAVVLTGADFEQGDVTYIVGANLETQKISSAYLLRTKSPIFMGGVIKSLKLEIPGYKVRAIGFDRDLNMTSRSALTATGPGVTLVVSASQYCVLTLEKDPLVAIVPADATAAQITYTATYDAKLVIVDSRVELNTLTAQGAIMIRPGGETATAPGATYPDTIIKNSNVVINGHATGLRTVSLMSEFIGCDVAIDATTDSQGAGVYSNVKNLTFTGLPVATGDVTARSIIQATDCDNFAVSPTIFPGLAEAITANQPFIFQGCNVPGGVFYHHAQIANTYKNIDFAKAQADLGKATANAGIALVSSEVEGMYRLYSNGFGALAESHDSVKSLNIVSADLLTSYGTTIYKDAYFNGLFDIAGTNVFGNKVRSHPLAQVLNVAPRAVQGIFNTITVGGTITGVTANANRVCVPKPFRVNGSKGLTINCPTGVEGSIVLTDINGVIKGLTTLATGESSVPAAQLGNTNAYLYFGKVGGAAITPADLAGVTVTVYNGCKIVNAGATAVNLKGNIRVEDNATLVNASITGSGYFGGNCVMSGMGVNGYAYMKDNTLCTGASQYLQTLASLVMEGNAVCNYSNPTAMSNLNLRMYDNSKMLGDVRTQVTMIMRDNATITSGSSLSPSCSGILTIKDNAVINGSSLLTCGDITLRGSYNQTVNKTWTGKRTITDVNAPGYDNNVKTQYDF